MILLLGNVIEDNVRDVLLKFLMDFGRIKGEVSQMDDDDLLLIVWRSLKGRRYLVILDDIWDVRVWERLSIAFPDDHNGSRILITSGSQEITGRPKISFQLRLLSFEQSRELLRMKVFSQNNCPQKLERYEMEIVRKCYGLPSVIAHVAATLRKHVDRVDWWKNVASGGDYINHSGIEWTEKTTQLMYSFLPNHLKLCFLYLNLFPKDVAIPVWKLIRLWIAEGLIEQEGNDCLEDIAEKYLEEFVDKNFVIAVQRSSISRIKTCQMQPAFREFFEKQGLLDNLFHETNANNLSLPTSNQYRHLCFNNDNILGYISGAPVGQRVRSFLGFVEGKPILEPKHFSCIQEAFKLLRVLETESLSFTPFPVNLFRLVLLKYVSISSDVSSLPSGISSLWNLQTLIVATSSPTLEITGDICMLPQFRHLHTNASTNLACTSTKSPKTEEEVLVSTNVQTLSTISPESCREEVFFWTPKVKKLGIRGKLAKLFELNGGSTLFENVGKLDLLKKLKLWNEDLALHGLPPEKSFPRRLTKLTLLNTLLDWKEMSTLAKLENLEVLKLKENALVGESWCTEDGGFRRLKHLHIEGVDLKVWKASKDHFPELRSLELRSCDMLEGIPLDLALIDSFRLLVLHDSSNSLATCAQEIEYIKSEQPEGSFKLSIKRSPSHN